VSCNRGTAAGGQSASPGRFARPGSPSGQAYLLAKTFARYMNIKSGRQLVYAVYLNDVPTAPASILETLMTADHDAGVIVAAVQQGYRGTP
jgi:hypothetical protein